MAIYLQHTITLPPCARGFHIITSTLNKSLKEPLSMIQVGLCHLFLQHTSASLTINENTDPDVRLDLEDCLNAIVPESNAYRHQDEGKDDLPAHVKSSLLGVSLTIPISNGRLALGTWQGIQLCEHRDQPSARHLIVTMHGSPLARVKSHA